MRFFSHEKQSCSRIGSGLLRVDSDNVNHELNGLYEAMRFFNRQNAKIVTFSNTDSFTDGDFSVKAIPAYQYLGT